MNDDLFEQRLRDAARSLPTPDAPPSLLDRVLAERKAGARIELPVEAPRRTRLRIRVLQVAAIAAGIIAVGTLVTARGARHSSTVSDADSISSLDRFFISTGVAPATAYAQTPPAAPGAPSVTGINALSLGGRRFEYRMQLVDTSGRITPDGDGTFTISAAQYENTPAWRVERVGHMTAENGQRRTEGETLYVTRRELRLLSRAVHQTPYLRFSTINIQQRFVGDSVIGVMTTDGGIRRPIARLLPRAFGPYLADMLGVVGLSGVPLHSTWRGSVSVVGWAVIPKDVFYPGTLRVVGEETLKTSAGSFDCWKLHVSAGSQQRIQWVRKSDGIALRSVDAAPPGPSGRREFLLLNP